MKTQFIFISLIICAFLNVPNARAQEETIVHKPAKKEKKAKTDGAMAHEKEQKELEARNKAEELKIKQKNEKLIKEKTAKKSADQHIYEEKLKKQKEDEAGLSTADRIKKSDDENDEFDEKDDTD